MNDLYALNPIESESRFLLAECKTEVMRRGQETQVHRMAYYDSSAYKLYISDHAQGVYILDGEEIIQKPNGVDGVLFHHDSFSTAFRYVECEKRPKEATIQSLILDRVNFAPADEGGLEHEDARFLLRLWLCGLFFASLQPTKPILTLVGPRGASKTLTCKLIGQLLFGPRWTVSSFYRREDFTTALSNSYLITWDNLDGRVNWANNLLAVAATGQLVEMRRLYTTNELVRFRPECFLALTSRDPRFKREDVVDRLLVFKLQEVKSFISEAHLLGEVIRNRDALMSELMDDLNGLVRVLRDTGDRREPIHFEFRMADWANLALLFSGESERDRVIGLLKQMDKARKRFHLEDTPLIELLSQWVEKNEGKEVTTGNLFEQLRVLDPSMTYKSSHALGMALKHRLGSLGEYFKIQERRGTANRKHYTFWLRKDKEQKVKETTDDGE